MFTHALFSRRTFNRDIPAKALLLSVIATSVVPLALGATALPSEAAAPTVSESVPAGPQGLSDSGQLPDTNYPVPSNAVYMSPSGDDGNLGTLSAPVKTLNRAVTIAPKNGTIVLRSGTYRDWYHNKANDSYAIVDKTLTFQAYPHEKPWLDGTDVVATSTMKKVKKDRFTFSWSTPEFCDGKYYTRAMDDQSKSPNTGPCAHWDMADTPSNPMSADPQMVFVDGVQINQVADDSQLDAKSFLYDWNKREITLGFDPKGKSVEVTRRPIAMILGGKNNFSVRGVGFRRYASNEFHNLTAAALYIGRSVSTVENTVFKDNAAGGLAYSSPQPGSSVSRSVFVDNGFTPLQGSGNAQQGTDNNFVVDNNLLLRNNAAGFGERCTVSCGQAAIKLARMRGIRISNNLVAETKNAAGIWCDLDCSNAQIVYNVVRDSSGSGIMYEVSDEGIIAGNVSVRNKYGINVPSANTKVYNNTLVDNMQGIKVYDDRRTRGTDGWNDIGPDTQNIDVVNNVVVGRNYSLLAMPMRPKSAAPNTGADEQIRTFDNNSFYQSNGKSPIFVYWQSMSGKESFYRTPADLDKDHGLSKDSLWSNDASNVFVGADDYRVTKTSGSYQSAAPLPDDVASALGLAASSSQRSAGVKLNRGALSMTRG